MDRDVSAVLERLGMRRRLGWLGPWGGFVLALAVGRVPQGKGVVHIDELVVGMPMAWAAGYAERRWANSWSLLCIATVVLLGLVIGLVAH
jgi:hypothetical protein